jgi:hypothetical protein
MLTSQRFFVHRPTASPIAPTLQHSSGAVASEGACRQPAPGPGVDVLRRVVRPGRAVLVGALAAQALLVAAQAGIPGSPGTSAAGVFALALAVAWGRRMPPPLLEPAIAAAALGGLGMALGTLLDGVAHAHGAHSPHGGWAPLVSWSTGLMLLFCIPVCGRACAASCRGLAPRVLGHAAVCAAMLAGMQGASRVPVPGGAVGTHLAMLAGMAAGAATAAAALRRLRASAAAGAFTPTPAGTGGPP